jgi:hypothetical protein
MGFFHKHKEKEKELALEAERHERELVEARDKLDEVTDADGVVSVEGFTEFWNSVGERGIHVAPEILKELRVRLAQGGVFVPSEDTTLILKKDETSLLDTPVTLLKEVADREFRGGSQGVSIPIGGGVRYRVGAMRGHMVTIGSHWSVADEGVLTVTDRRAVYHGGRKTLEFPFAKLATLNVYSDAIDLGVTSRQSTSSFGTSHADLIAGIIHGAISHEDGIKILRVQSGA